MLWKSSRQNLKFKIVYFVLFLSQNIFQAIYNKSTKRRQYKQCITNRRQYKQCITKFRQYKKCITNRRLGKH